MRLWLDTEFNGYKGELISMALVDDNGREWYEACWWKGNTDQWVIANVIPVLNTKLIAPHEMQTRLTDFLSAYDAVHVVADWPEDIEFFCGALITGPGERIDTPPLTMEVRRDLNTDASLVPHNALADARALRLMGMGSNATELTGARRASERGTSDVE